MKKNSKLIKMQPVLLHVRAERDMEYTPPELALVEPHMPKDRLTIIEADALRWTANNQEPFDCAWHDLWTDRSAGEPHLDHWHAALLMNCRKTVRHQGAWAMDKQIKRHLVRRGFQWMG